jgi:hypothetical protein
MPGNPRRQITAKAEERFPTRIVIRTPPGGFGYRYDTMMNWLDEHCGVDRWAIGPAGTHGVQNDAIAVYVGNPTCALAFIARWCMPGDPSGMYEFRQSDPEARVPIPGHSTPG